jgi:hypothetical protein
MSTRRTIGRMYYTLAALTAVAVACLPWLVPLSYRALGVDPALVDAGTHAAFQAHLATYALRGRLLAGVLLPLALGLLTLSLTALVLRVVRRGDAMAGRLPPWPLLVLTAAGAAGVAVIVVAGLTAGVCC